ncbi:MAG: Glycogen synthase [Candidatus Peribacteria bacterium GW2011_GWB1_54_5]|nr:MAG: Glycogen synthase [Candidatus Peribacteria bacterium GW2011_GWB1_54_5]
MPKVAVTTESAAPKEDVRTLNEKPKVKAALQKECGWPMEPKCPVICIPTGMTKELGGKLFEQLLPGLLSLDVEILILGKGSSSYGSFITGLAEEQNHRIAIIPKRNRTTASPSSRTSRQP